MAAVRVSCSEPPVVQFEAAGCCKPGDDLAACGRPGGWTFGCQGAVGRSRRATSTLRHSGLVVRWWRYGDMRFVDGLVTSCGSAEIHIDQGLDNTVDQRIQSVHVLHVVGRADLGIESRDDSGEKALLPLLDRPDAESARGLLLLRRPGRTAGKVAPLASAVAAIDGDEALSGSPLRLVLVATDQVAEIAHAIERTLDSSPGLYGRPFENVVVVRSPSLEETDVAGAVRRVLETRQSLGERAALVWGSGSTQAAFGVMDAAFLVGMPLSVVRVDPLDPGQHDVFDPTRDLAVDPVVPLLRRWRYHDLLVDLVRRGAVSVTQVQRDLLEREAEQWGRAYAEPNASRLRAVMAAALMRGDATSGFAARAYICHRYTELRERDTSQVDLLAWAGSRPGGGSLGKKLGILREERRDAAVTRSLNSEGGQWLRSSTSEQLNEMGADSSHELRPPSRLMLVALGQHLSECESSTTTPVSDAALSSLSLVPGHVLCYVSILGTSPQDTSPQDRGSSPLEQIAEALADEAKRGLVDRPVRTYLGVHGDEPVSVRMLILGTASQTYAEARALAVRLAEFGAVAVSIPDVETNAFTGRAAADLLRAHLGPDAGAVIVVPSGPKKHVLPLMIGAFHVGSERGIPVFLRQLVTKGQDVVGAGTHRLPLRFGTDLAILSAALYALDIAELDMAARLLGSIGAGQGLDKRAMALSYALRSDTRGGSVGHWPATITEGLSTLGATAGLVADRIEVWASLPGLDTDIATQTRAIIGACAAIESSMRSHDRDRRRKVDADGQARVKALRAAGVDPLFRVRNRLPITHGGSVAVSGLSDLVNRCSGGRYADTRGLLRGMAAIARVGVNTPQGGSGPSLAQLVDEMRAEVRSLRDAEQGRRDQAHQVT